MSPDETVRRWWRWFVSNICIDSSYLDISVKICIKPVSSDVHVSGSIKREGAWELQTVNNVIKAMQRFPNATFLGRWAWWWLVMWWSSSGMFDQILAPTWACTPWWSPPLRGRWLRWMLIPTTWPTSGGHWSWRVTLAMWGSCTTQWGEREHVSWP